MTPEPRRFVHDSVRVHMWVGSGNVIRLTGVMREPNVGTWLAPLIDEIDRVAIEQRMREVVLDIRGLAYANVALWRCLVLWLKRIRTRPDAHYNVRLISDSGHRWQQIGVPTLRVFGKDSRGTDRLIIQEQGA